MALFRAGPHYGTVVVDDMDTAPQPDLVTRVARNTTGSVGPVPCRNRIGETFGSGPSDC